MTKLSSLLFLISFTSISWGQGTIETEKTGLKELILQSFDGVWSTLDSKNMDKYYTRDFLLLENGKVWNNDSIRNYLDNALLKKPNPKRVNTIEVIDIRVEHKQAWIAYKNSATFSVEDKIVRQAQWLESAVAIKTERGWKLEMLHSTRVKNELFSDKQ